jgi:hypothetical protein
VKLTPRQEHLFAKLYDDLMTFKFAKTKTDEEIKALVLELIIKIDEATPDPHQIRTEVAT